MAAIKPLELLQERDAWAGTIGGILRSQADRTPDAPCLITSRGVSTYEQVLARARRFAGFIREVETTRGGTCVAVLAEKCEELYWIRFGVNLAGATFCALNPQHSGPSLLSAIRRLKAEILVIDAANLAALPVGVMDTVCCVVRLGPETNHFADTVVAAWPRALIYPFEATMLYNEFQVVNASAGDRASIVFTSGSTGPSKAVMVPNGQFARGGAQLACAMRMTSDDVWHDWSPLYHVGGQLHVTMSALASGAAIAVVPRFSMSSFWGEVRLMRCSLIIGFPIVAHRLLDRPIDPTDHDHAVRLAVIAGSSTQLRHRFQQRFSVPVVDSYGLTEAEPVTLPDLDGPEGNSGRINPDFEVAVLDPRDQPCSPGVAGRVGIRPRRPFVMMLGYDDPAETVAACRNLWFHTQDSGRLDENGYFYFLERDKHALRRRGENISRRELENAALGHDSVTDCVALSVPVDDDPEPEIKMVVVVKRDATLTPAMLHKYLSEHVARFMLPRFIEFAPALAYSELGKPDIEIMGLLADDTWDARRGVALPQSSFS